MYSWFYLIAKNEAVVRTSVDLFRIGYSTLRLYFSAQLYLWIVFLSIISIIDVSRAGLRGGPGHCPDPSPLRRNLRDERDRDKISRDCPDMVVRETVLSRSMPIPAREGSPESDPVIFIITVLLSFEEH